MLRQTNKPLMASSHGRLSKPIEAWQDPGQRCPEDLNQGNSNPQEIIKIKAKDEKSIIGAFSAENIEIELTDVAIGEFSCGVHRSRKDEAGEIRK